MTEPSPGEGRREGAPKNGVRYELVRVDAAGPEAATATVYRGHLLTRDGSMAIEARVEHASVEVSVRIGALDGGPGLDATETRVLEKAGAALVRATVRSYLADGRLPPRRILRWRERG